VRIVMALVLLGVAVKAGLTDMVRG
jgi:hypothetical protein